MSCGVGRRRGWDLALLWLWHRPAVVAPIRPLAWEPPYAPGAALKRKKEKKKKERKRKILKLWLQMVPQTQAESPKQSAGSGGAQGKGEGIHLRSGGEGRPPHWGLRAPTPPPAASSLLQVASPPRAPARSSCGGSGPRPPGG